VKFERAVEIVGDISDVPASSLLGPSGGAGGAYALLLRGPSDRNSLAGDHLPGSPRFRLLGTCRNCGAKVRE